MSQRIQANDTPSQFEHSDEKTAQKSHNHSQRFNSIVSASLVSVFLALSVNSGPVQAGEAIAAIDNSLEREDNKQLVKTLLVDAPERTVVRTFFGKISAKQTVDLGFQQAGKIVKLDAIEGSFVKKGSVIATLDKRPFELEVAIARLAAEQAKRQLQRFQKLKGNTISEASVQNAETDAKLTQTRLERAEYALSQTEIRAPFDGIIAERKVEKFSTAGAGLQVVRIHDMSQLRVDIEVPEVLVRQISRERKPEFSAIIPKLDLLLPLTFQEIRAETSPIGQTYKIRLGMAPPHDRQLLPGASVLVKAKIENHDLDISIPPSAISISVEGKTSVLTIAKKEDALFLERKSVNLNVGPNGDIVVENGLTQGDEIVVGGINALQEGQLVRRFPLKAK